jgi:hypothetical protein
MLDEVQREALAGEERACRALERRQRLAGRRAVAVRRVQRDGDVAELLEDQLEEREATDDERLLRREAAASARGGRDEGLGGAVALAEVLLEGELDEGRDEGLVEDRISRRGRRVRPPRAGPDRREGPRACGDRIAEAFRKGNVESSGRRGLYSPA